MINIPLSPFVVSNNFSYLIGNKFWTLVQLTIECIVYKRLWFEYDIVSKSFSNNKSFLYSLLCVMIEKLQLVIELCIGCNLVRAAFLMLLPGKFSWLTCGWIFRFSGQDYSSHMMNGFLHQGRHAYGVYAETETLVIKLLSQ